MEILPRQTTAKGASDCFAGDVWVNAIATATHPASRMEVVLVRFSPGARTAWHSHPMGQTLHIVSGGARVQARGGEVIELHAGQTIYTPPGEEHWHGASEDEFMSHLAMYERDDDGEAVRWMEHVEAEERA